MNPVYTFTPYDGDLGLMVRLDFSSVARAAENWGDCSLRVQTALQTL
jgi:hypothetical protein